jgi:hypothetical protein
LNRASPDDLTESNAAKRDEVLKRMLKMKPKPHAPLDKKPMKRSKKKPGKRSRASGGSNV